MTNADTAAPQAVRKVVIAGGGTAGWVMAMALSKHIGELLDITLVESEEIGTIGVGESTVPPIVAFHQYLGLDEREFMVESAATFKVAIRFDDWGHLGNWYLHPFGRYGKPTWTAEFHHFWLHARSQGHKVPLGEYCYEWLAAVKDRFALREDPRVNYAYHFDAFLYARWLRRIAEKHGVKRVEGRIKQVKTRSDNGFVEALELEDGRVIPGDFFVDCTGFRGLLIEGALQTGYDDWTNYLPCDRAVAFQTIVDEPPKPYTACYAHTAGWRWNIPVQHRVGNGVVYCSQYMSDDEARDKLVKDSGGRPVKEPWIIRIKAGSRKKAWNKNVVAIGLSAGFIEPLESTSIHTIVSATARFLRLFPFGGVTETVANHYNQLTRYEIERIRDFVCMHYHYNTRQDSEFWKECAAMRIPDSLRERVELFREGAHVYSRDNELFTMDSWVSIMLGQNIEPKSWNKFASLDDRQLKTFMNQYRSHVAEIVNALPRHGDFVKQYAPASELAWDMARSGAERTRLA